MKKHTIILALILFGFNCFSQHPLDKALKDISDDLAGKLKLQGKEKIVVLFITDINKKTTIAGTYLADNISYNLVNDTAFKVFERESLSMIAEAKSLIDEGYVTADNSKMLGKLLSVNAIIIGNYTVFSNTIKLSLKALSTYNGATIAASMMDLPLNADAGVILGIDILSPNENASRNHNCKEKNTGDYCFQNNLDKTVTVIISIPYVDNRQIISHFTLTANQNQCIYDLPIGTFNYSISEDEYNDSYGGLTLGVTQPVYLEGNNYNNREIKFKANGQFFVELCKSKTLIIK